MVSLANAAISYTFLQTYALMLIVSDGCYCIILTFHWFCLVVFPAADDNNTEECNGEEDSDDETNDKKDMTILVTERGEDSEHVACKVVRLAG